MPPEETPAPEASQPVADSSSPAVEASAPATEPATPPQETSPATTAPETPPATAEAVPVQETAPVSAEATTGTQSTTPTAQMAGNEPIVLESEPFDSAQDKPTYTPEPPSSAASAPAPVIPQTGILRTARDVLVKARVAIQDRKRKKRDKIMAAMNAKNKITNDEVEKLLHVSDATATRYLSALEKEGKIKQVGRTGTGVMYSRAQ